MRRLFECLRRQRRIRGTTKTTEIISHSHHLNPTKTLSTFSSFSSQPPYYTNSHSWKLRFQTTTRIDVSPPYLSPSPPCSRFVFIRTIWYASITSTVVMSILSIIEAVSVTLSILIYLHVCVQFFLFFLLQMEKN